ncbi:MAG: hypothetical protein ACRDHN_06935 [Thermomicrobiales bacterium]
MDFVPRIQQGLLALRPHPEPDEAEVARRWLSDEQHAAFLSLPVHDRAHLVRVARALVASGTATDDLVIAGLLHDIGKVDGKHHVRLIDRALKVCLERVAPRLLDRLANQTKTVPLCARLVLAVHHPEIGSERARLLGCTERTCWLIKNHDNLALADPDLHHLIEVDRSTP